MLVFQPLIFDNQPNPYQKPIYITNHCPTNGKTGHFRPVSIRNGGYVLPTTTQPMAKLAISGQCRSETAASVGWIFCPPLRLIQNSNNMIVDTFKKKKNPVSLQKQHNPHMQFHIDFKNNDLSQLQIQERFISYNEEQNKHDPTPGDSMLLQLSEYHTLRASHIEV